MLYNLLYYFVLVPISLLPYSLIRGISSLFYLLLYYVVAYRKKIVHQNITNSFPAFSEEEKTTLSKKFYKHLCDTFFEGLISFTVSKPRLLKHISCKNPELINAYFERNQSVIIAIGHYNSWELFLTGLNALIKHQVVIIYQPLSNSFINKKLMSARESFGTRMITKEETKSFFNTKSETPCATLFAIDQWPANAKNPYWMQFLNQETAVAYGTEKYAKDYNLPVLYARINKEKRGYYNIEFFDVCQSSKHTEYGFITEAVTKRLEKDILEKPEFWLWSHRRWKQKRKDVKL